MLLGVCCGANVLSLIEGAAAGIGENAIGQYCSLPGKVDQESALAILAAVANAACSRLLLPTCPPVLEPHLVAEQHKMHNYILHVSGPDLLVSESL